MDVYASVTGGMMLILQYFLPNNLDEVADDRTCLERPPVYKDCFGLTNRTVVPDKFHCTVPSNCIFLAFSPSSGHLLVLVLVLPLLELSTSFLFSKS